MRETSDMHEDTYPCRNLPDFLERLGNPGKGTFKGVKINHISWGSMPGDAFGAHCFGNQSPLILRLTCL